MGQFTISVEWLHLRDTSLAIGFFTSCITGQTRCNNHVDNMAIQRTGQTEGTHFSAAKAHVMTATYIIDIHLGPIFRL